MISELLDKWTRRSEERKLYFRVPEDHVLDGNFASVRIKPNANYFQIRLAEMYLRDKREYWRDFNPLTLSVSDFLYDTRRQNIPFFVGNQLLQNIRPYLDGQYVELRNTRILGPVPYVGDDVGLFVGLVRVQASDLATRFFNLLEKVVKAFDLTSLSRYLEIAKPLGEGLNSFLGMKENELRFGFRDVFTAEEGDAHCFRQGYLACVNCAENEQTPEFLWIKEGRLFTGTRDDCRPAAEHDYCLVKIECLEQRSDYQVLPFYRLWEDVRAVLLGRDTLKAQWKKIELLQALANSLDLTDEHRDALIEFFTVKFLAMEEKLRNDRVRQPGSRGAAVSRGALDKTVGPSPTASLQEAARAAERANLAKPIVRRLMTLSENWNRISQAGCLSEDRAVDAALINSQIALIGKLHSTKRPNSRQLADAITFATMRP